MVDVWIRRAAKTNPKGKGGKKAKMLVYDKGVDLCRLKKNILDRAGEEVQYSEKKKTAKEKKGFNDSDVKREKKPDPPIPQTTSCGALSTSTRSLH